MQHVTASSLSMAAAERRNSARTPVFMLVRNLQTRDGMFAWDIGMGGMQCRARRPLWPGTYLDLGFKLPETSELLEVGGQVMTLNDGAQGDLGLGVRFCAISRKAQLALYRFLDRRRLLWDPSAEQPRPQPALPAMAEANSARPFEALLLEAYASLRAKELRPLGFTRSAWSSAPAPISC